MNELWLIFRCQHGDPNAFAELYNQYKNKVFGTAFHFVRNQTLAEDITQEVFISVFQNISGLRNPSAFRTWLYRIAISKINHLLRREGTKYRSVPLDDLFDSCHRTSDILTEALNLEDINALRDEIRNLPDELRLPIILHYYAELRIKEIATILEIPSGTVKSRLHTARSRLAAALNSDFINNKRIIRQEVRL